MSIVERIRAHGGDVVRDEWRITLRPGRMTPEAISWVKAHKANLTREVWPAFDDWEERAAILEYDEGMSRDEAEAMAYRRVAGC